MGYSILNLDGVFNIKSDSISTVAWFKAQVNSRPYTYCYLQKNYMPNPETMSCP